MGLLTNLRFLQLYDIFLKAMCLNGKYIILNFYFYKIFTLINIYRGKI